MIDFEEEIDFEPEEEGPSETPNVSKGVSAGRGFLQGGTFGFSDELTGGINAVIDAAGSEYGISDIPKRYEHWRDVDREKNQAASDANPWVYGGSEIAGNVATSMIPAGLAASSAARTGRAAAAADKAWKTANVTGDLAEGAAQFAKAKKLKAALDISGKSSLGSRLAAATGQGALLGTGKSEADNLEDLATDAAVGSAIGLAGGGLAEAGGAMLRSLPKGAAAAANRAVGVDKADVTRLGVEKAEEVGQKLLDAGVFKKKGGVGPFGNAEAIRGKAMEMQAKGSKLMSEMYEAIDKEQLASLSPQSIADQFITDTGKLWSHRMNRNLLGTVEDIAKTIEEQGSEMSLGQAQKLKMLFSEKAYPPGASTNPMNDIDASNRALYRQAYNLISKQIDDAVQKGSNALERLEFGPRKTVRKISSAELNRLYQEGKKMYALGSEATRIVNDKIAKEMTSKGSGLGPLGVGHATGTTLSNTTGSPLAYPAGFAGGMLAYQAKNAVGDSVRASAYPVLARMGKWAAPLTAAANKGARSLATTWYLLEKNYGKEFLDAAEKAQSAEEE